MVTTKKYLKLYTKGNEEGIKMIHYKNQLNTQKKDNNGGAKRNKTYRKHITKWQRQVLLFCNYYENKQKTSNRTEE